jgi:hypothetical protein
MHLGVSSATLTNCGGKKQWRIRAANRSDSPHLSNSVGAAVTQARSTWRMASRPRPTGISERVESLTRYVTSQLS